MYIHVTMLSLLNIVIITIFAAVATFVFGLLAIMKVSTAVNLQLTNSNIIQLAEAKKSSYVAQLENETS